MRRFKTRKKFNKFLLYLGIFLISMAFSIKYLYSNKLINNNTIIDLLLSDTVEPFSSKDIKDVDFLLKYALNVDLIKSKESNTLDSDSSLDVFKDDDINEEENKNKEESNPIVYIYNTHQEEKYESPYLGAYNIATGVLQGSKILKEYLKDEGINAYVEEEDITNMIHTLNLKYSDSYSVSRMLLEERKQEIPSLKYFIDLHRDSSIYDKTTTKIDNESYAKILLVVGLEHDNYEKNLAKSIRLSELIKEYNPDLFRGITKKSGKGVNGIYNQDFDENTMLIEVGGQYNNISEVNNTLKVLAKLLKKFIEEDDNE